MVSRVSTATMELTKWSSSGGRELAKLVRARLEEAGTKFLDAVEEIALDKQIEPRTRLVALIHLLDRQIGKAPEAITVDHKHEVKAMVANITPELQGKITDVITALRSPK